MEVDIQQEIDLTKSILEIVKEVQQQDLSWGELETNVEALDKFANNYYLRLVNQK